MKDCLSRLYFGIAIGPLPFRFQQSDSQEAYLVHWTITLLHFVSLLCLSRLMISVVPLAQQLTLPDYLTIFCLTYKTSRMNKLDKDLDNAEKQIKTLLQQWKMWTSSATETEDTTLLDEGGCDVAIQSRHEPRKAEQRRSKIVLLKFGQRAKQAGLNTNFHMIGKTQKKPLCIAQPGYVEVGSLDLRYTDQC